MHASTAVPRESLVSRPQPPPAPRLAPVSALVLDVPEIEELPPLAIDLEDSAAWSLAAIEKVPNCTNFCGTCDETKLDDDEHYGRLLFHLDGFDDGAANGDVSCEGFDAMVTTSVMDGLRVAGMVDLFDGEKTMTGSKTRPRCDSGFSTSVGSDGGFNPSPRLLVDAEM